MLSGLLINVAGSQSRYRSDRMHHEPHQERGHAAAQQLPPRSRRDPERGDLLALLPGRPIVADICVPHPLAASAVKAAARNTGATTKGEDSLKRDKYSRTGMGVCENRDGWLVAWAFCG